MSESSYKAGDLDSVLVCGQLNDDELEKQNGFKPDYYIITSYDGNHYKLIGQHFKVCVCGKMANHGRWEEH